MALASFASSLNVFTPREYNIAPSSTRTHFFFLSFISILFERSFARRLKKKQLKLVSPKISDFDEIKKLTYSFTGYNISKFNFERIIERGESYIYKKDEEIITIINNQKPFLVNAVAPEQ